jgi:hypothetical protein
MFNDRSNFEGDWEKACAYCGAPHIDHQKKYPHPDGGAYLHRMPCPQEQHAIKKRLVRERIILRSILFFYGICKYIWNKIPFKDEGQLLWQFVKHIFISIRALIFLRGNKPQ